MRHTIILMIGFTVISWWIGILFLQTINIYPFNNYIIDYSSIGLFILIGILTVHDKIVFNSIANIFDFFPDMKGVEVDGEISPTFEDWISKKMWKSFPKWFTGITALGILITFIGNNSFSLPNINNEIETSINQNKIYREMIGKVKGFSTFKGGKAFTSDDSTHFDLTIRVYGEKGNFPLEVNIDYIGNKHKINDIQIKK